LIENKNLNDKISFHKIFIEVMFIIEKVSSKIRH